MLLICSLALSARITFLPSKNPSGPECAYHKVILQIHNSSESAGGTSQAGLTRDEDLSKFWSALASATEKEIDGAKYLVLVGARFPHEGELVVDRILVRECYKWFEKHTRSHLQQTDKDGKQIADLIYMLRGNPGESTYT